MANELDALDQFLYERLGADNALTNAAPGGVHRDVADENEVLPAVVFQYLGGSDNKAPLKVGAARIWTEAVVLVKVVAKDGESTTLATAVDRVDELLEGAQGLVGTARVYSCKRDSPFSQPVTEKGITYRQVGGIYRLQIQEPAAV